MTLRLWLMLRTRVAMRAFHGVGNNILYYIIESYPGVLQEQVSMYYQYDIKHECNTMYQTRDSDGGIIGGDASLRVQTGSELKPFLNVHVDNVTHYNAQILDTDHISL